MVQNVATKKKSIILQKFKNNYFKLSYEVKFWKISKANLY